MNNFMDYHGLSAQNFLEKLASNSTFSVAAPINVDWIVTLLGVELNENINFDEISTAGSVSIGSQNAVIWINPVENSYPPRRRFTIAHEIGHLILHMDPKAGVREFVDTKKTLNRRDSYWDLKEYEANNFAAQLLMPIELINEHGKRIIGTYKKRWNEEKMPILIFIEEMADLFEVSEPAMKYRLKNIGSIK